MTRLIIPYKEIKMKWCISKKSSYYAYASILQEIASLVLSLSRQKIHWSTYVSWLLQMDQANLIFKVLATSQAFEVIEPDVCQRQAMDARNNETKHLCELQSFFKHDWSKSSFNSKKQLLPTYGFNICHPLHHLSQ